MRLTLSTKNGNKEIVFDTDKIVAVEKNRFTNPIEMSLQIYFSDTMHISIIDSNDSNYREVYAELLKLGWIKDKEITKVEGLK